jgi:hypothetical protein
MGCSSGLGNYFNDEAGWPAKRRWRSDAVPRQARRSSWSRIVKYAPLGRAGRAATQHPSAADGQGLDPGPARRNSAREPDGTKPRV